MENATPVEQTPIQLESPVPPVVKDSVETAPISTPEPAINVLKKKLDDLELKTKLLSELSHPMIKTVESKAMEQIEKLTLEAIDQFLSSETPGELPKKVKKEKVQMGKGTVTAL